MSHTSPTSLLVWAVLCVLVEAFLIFHLWSFDRFRCLRWNSGPTSGAFKRTMTYSYTLTIPLIAAYAIGMSAIKYTEGYISIPFHGIVPKPYQLWPQAARDSVFPLTLGFSIAWGLEMVIHLEELCFWLFLINSGSAQREWFNSLYFKFWALGSTVAVLYMPLVTIFTREDPLKNEAYTFLAGSLGDLSITLWFMPVLWTFPSFLQNLRNEGVDSKTIVRLTKFCELNNIRIIFRYLFVVPLLILGVDGVRPHHHINENPFWTDFLAILGGFGCAISSVITLVIFFPRSIEGEIAARDASKERRRVRSRGPTTSIPDSRMLAQSPSYNYNYYNNSNDYNASSGGTYLLTTSPVRKTSTYGPESYDSHWDESFSHGHGGRMDTPDKLSEARDTLASLPPIRPNRRKEQDGVELGGLGSDTASVDIAPRYTVHSNVNRLVHNFTSPIDLASAGNPQSASAWLTFSRN